ncbi:hypothetical protein CXG81DRAFT_10876 [Caulochytrium protostelioides]|uniref:TOG domain-containing protein n=1 Tax=Caulochytrium protostelioides TaxID=1555241 RepID=A0A4V1IV02_9FUNG|nr:hypothetical protein CXG81DRAFT_10876 [Caulochytrium protostelioides]|eukprot:RKP02349.1 hypothetical protein CXG81DRAFT_10876 [Caulochytrium protostelioides]
MDAVDAALAPVSDELVAMLHQLASPDNEARKAAEARLNDHWLGAQPHLLLTGLSKVMLRHASVQLRAFSAVLLRRMALKIHADDSGRVASHWLTVPAACRQYCEHALLESLEKENESSVKHKVSDAISEIAKHVLSRSERWDGLLDAIAACMKSPIASHRENALRILADVPRIVPLESFQQILDLYKASLADPTAEVRLNAIAATVAFLKRMQMSEPEASGQVLDTVSAQLVPLIMNAVNVLATDNQEDELLKAITQLIDLTEYLPKAFRPILEHVVTFMSQLMNNTEFDEPVRHIGLELLLALAERAPGMCRKVKSFTPTTISIALNWMTHLEDEASWYVADADDYDESSDACIGEQAMDRLARSIGPKSVLPVTFHLLPAMLNSPEWQQRHAALMAISSIGEGCQKVMQGDLGSVVDLVHKHLADPHPRVRYAACNAIGQMCTDFGPQIQTDYHHVVLTHLVPLLDDQQFPRVQAHAAAALINFCECAGPEIMEPWLDHIVQKLITLLNQGKIFLQQQAITTLATVADSAGPQFVRFYPSIMPVLFNILRQATTDAFQLLRGKTLECASLMALAVGRETFLPDAPAFIQILSESQKQIDANPPEDDTQITYLHAAWARVCKILGQDFVPYLDLVIPSLLVSAQLKPDFAIIQSPEEAEEKAQDDDSWEFLEIDGQRIGIRTANMEEKCTACEMLVCYARDLGEGFVKYAPKVMTVAVPLLKFYFHDGVRAAAATLIPHLFQSWIKAGTPIDTVLPIFHESAHEILTCLISDPDPEFIGQLCCAFYESLQLFSAYPQALTDDHLKTFTEAVVNQLQEYVARLAERTETRGEDGHDAEDEEALQEDESTDEGLLAELSRVVHEVIKHQGPRFAASFAPLKPMLDQLVQANDPRARQWAICVYDDMIEFLGPESVHFAPSFSPVILAGLTDAQSADVRQSSCYGVGVMAAKAGPAYLDVCVEALPQLFQLVQHADARAEAHALVTDNALAAIGKICRAFGASGRFNLPEVHAAWINALPILEDDEEAAGVCEYLLELVLSGQPNIRALLPQIKQSLETMVQREALLADHEDVRNKVIGFLTSH